MNKDLKIKHGFTLAEVFSVHPKGGRKHGFTLAEVFSVHPKDIRKHAFTLAEVLITLGIIGVVAAMTLPTLIQKHQKKVTVTKLKKAYTTLAQVIQKSYADNGSALDYLPAGQEITADVTENFFNTYYLPYFKSPSVILGLNIDFKNGCDKRNYKSLNAICYGTAIYTNYSAGRIFFSANDGMTYFVVSKTRETLDNQTKYLYDSNHLVFVDINGFTKPNQLGKDIFLFTIDWSNNIIRPYGYNMDITQINQNCSKTGGGSYCAAKIINDGWEIKDDYPW